MQLDSIHKLIKNVEHHETVVCPLGPIKEIYLFDPVDGDIPTCFVTTDDTKHYVGFDFQDESARYVMNSWDTRPNRIIIDKLEFNGDYSNISPLEIIPAIPKAEGRDQTPDFSKQHLFLNRKVALVVNNVVDSLTVQLLPTCQKKGVTSMQITDLVKDFTRLIEFTRAPSMVRGAFTFEPLVDGLPDIFIANLEGNLYTGFNFDPEMDSCMIIELPNITKPSIEIHGVMVDLNHTNHNLANFFLPVTQYYPQGNNVSQKLTPIMILINASKPHHIEVRVNQDLTISRLKPGMDKTDTQVFVRLNE